MYFISTVLRNPGFQQATGDIVNSGCIDSASCQRNFGGLPGINNDEVRVRLNCDYEGRGIDTANLESCFTKEVTTLDNVCSSQLHEEYIR